MRIIVIAGLAIVRLVYGLFGPRGPEVDTSIRIGKHRIQKGMGACD